MNEPGALDRLAALAGILPSYEDAWGEQRRLGQASKRALLGAMGMVTETPKEIEASIRHIEEAPWRRPLPPVLVIRHARGVRVPVEIVLAPGRAAHPVAWRFETETGEMRDGQLRFSDLRLVGSRTVDGERLERRVFTVPVPVGMGYHSFRLFPPDGNGEGVTLPVIAAPRRCFGGARHDGPGGRHWGLVLQLYGLRSRRNWGIGDFSDLADIVRIGARFGAAAIGLNPMHALFPENPDHVSPYSPSHRQFLGVWYIDVEAVPELSECPEAQRLVASAALRARLQSLRALPLVDYPGVAAAKGPIFELLYETFRERHLGSAASGRGADFRRFQQRKGETLERLAVFQALAERFGPGSWRDWPAGYRDPGSREVAAFAAEHRDRVEFFQYLQWQADQQLRTAAATARDAGMAIGLYHDLALAADGSGAEAWTNQGLLARGATIGAPPDDWNLKGQNWGLPPYNPMALRAAAFRPFIEVLRANMAHGGALRVDHVMGFERLFWIPSGARPQDGGYVRYPVEALFAILALESRRQKCLVIGEDLGTVPEGFRQRMRRAAVLSCRLLYFSQNARGDFLKPARYPAPAAVAANTHDIATLAGFWRGRDLEVRADLDLFPSEAAKVEAFERRAGDRRALVRALQREGLLSPGFRIDEGGPPFELFTAVFRFLARTPSRLLLLDIADVLGEVEQMNVPGTVAQYPNWRRKMLIDLETLARDPRLSALAGAIGEERGQGAGHRAAGSVGR